MSINKMDFVLKLKEEIVDVTTSVTYYDRNQDDHGNTAVVTDYGYVRMMTQDELDDVENIDTEFPLRWKLNGKLTHWDIIKDIQLYITMAKKQLVKDIENL